VPCVEEDAKRANQSPVWKHFQVPRDKDGKEEPGVVQCKLCGKKLAKHEGTTTMWNHLKAKHLIQHAALKQSETESPIQRAFAGHGGGFQPHIFRRKLAATFVMRDWAFHGADCPFVKDLFSYCNRNAKVPADCTVQRDVVKLYQQKKREVAAMLKRIPSAIACTTDGWKCQGASGMKFLAVTATWVHEGLRRSCLLGFKVMEDGRGATIYETFKSIVFDTMGLQGRIFGVTLDNESANDSFMELLEEDGHIMKEFVSFLITRECVSARARTQGYSSQGKQEFQLEHWQA
jgi:hypothetical protein